MARLGPDCHPEHDDGQSEPLQTSQARRASAHWPPPSLTGVGGQTTPSAVDRSDLLALARAVSAGDWAYELGPTNKLGCRYPLADLCAAASVAGQGPGGPAFVVVPKPGVLTVDLDTSGRSDEDAAAAAEALEELRGAIARTGVGAVVVASGRPGHRHLFANLGQDHRAARAVGEWCRSRGLDVRDQGIRPPLSPHRLGAEVSLLSHAGPQAALVALAAEPPVGSYARVAKYLGVLPLSQKMWTCLRQGHTAAGYESPSHGRMALAVQAQARGYSMHWLASALDHEDNVLGETWRAKSHTWRRQELVRLWGKAAAYIASNAISPPVMSRPEALSLCAKWESDLGTVPWSGMAGATDLAVAEGLAALATGAGGPVFAAALTQIALAGGVSLCTARRAMKRLMSSGIVAQVQPATPTRATVYRLVPAAKPTSPERVGATSQSQPVAEAHEGLGSDLSRWRGIGKSAARVLRCLSAHQMSARDLAAALRSSPGAVSALLRKLAAYGLATKSSGGWVLGPAGREETAERLGVAGLYDRDAATYAHQRALRAKLRERWSRAVHEARLAAETGDLASFGKLAAIVPQRVLDRVWSQHSYHCPSQPPRALAS